MGFPTDPLNVQLELYVDGDWLDVTGDLRQNEAIGIRRGSTDELAEIAPSECTFVLSNADNVYNTRNPLSPYYGLIGRNTRVRLTVNEPVGLETFESVTLSLGFRQSVDSFSDWARSSTFAHTGTWSYRSGAVDVGLSSFFYLTVPASAVELTLWYKLVSVAGGFTVIKQNDDGSTVVIDVNGTVDWTELTFDVTDAEYVFVGVAGGSSGDAAYVDDLSFSGWRFHGEVAEWSPDSNLTGSDRYVTVSASGVSRRLDQATTPVRDRLRSFLNDVDDPDFIVDEYWPMEEGGSARSIASDVGNAPLLVTTTAESSQVYGAGDFNLHWLPSGVQLPADAVLNAPTSNPSFSDGWAVVFMYAGTDNSGLTVVTVAAGNTTWLLTIDTIDNLIHVAEPEGDLVSFAPDFDVFDGAGKLFELRVAIASIDADWRLTISSNFMSDDYAGHRARYFTTVGTSSNTPVGPVTNVTFTQDDDGDPVAIGHLAVIATTGTVSSVDFTPLEIAATGEVDEPALDRLTRLAADADVGFRSVHGTTWSTAALGPQPLSTLYDQLNEVAQTDRGLIVEDRNDHGYVFRPLTSLYDDDADWNVSLIVDVDAAQLLVSPPQVNDDQRTLNDATVRDAFNNAYRYQQLTGPLNVTDPPPTGTGVGRYDQTVDVNTAREQQLPSLAEWIVSVGTVDVARYPTVTVNLASPAVDPVRYNVIGVDVGDLIVLRNAQSLGVYDDVRLLVVGYDEQFTAYTWTITFNCVPADALRGFMTYSTTLDNAELARLATGTGSTIASLTTTATSVVATSTGAPWTTLEEPFDVVVGGERMTVTNVASATSPQTLTLTRSVNGVVKSHDASSPIQLAQPARLGLRR